MKRREPLMAEYRTDAGLWTIAAHDDEPIAEGKEFAADMRVVLALDGEAVRHFTYPGYRIWTLLAHWTDGLDTLPAPRHRAS